MKLVHNPNYKSTFHLVICEDDANLSTIGIPDKEAKQIQNELKSKVAFSNVMINEKRYLVFRKENGKTPTAQLESSRKLAATCNRELNRQKIKSATILFACKNEDDINAFIEAFVLSNYQFLKYFSDKKDRINSLQEVVFTERRLNQKKLDTISLLCDAVYTSRDLVNEPVSYLTAVQLSKEIESLSKKYKFGFTCFDKKKITSLKMGGLLAVNKGSIDPPTFTILEYKAPKAKNKKPIILVGKGVVYDTGGLSLKPTANSMDLMKSDMAGAAAVVGVFQALATHKLPLHVIGLIPATDNRPGENAYAPGDVIHMHNGKTVEMLNADAEGRMILADALSYAAQYKPELVIDLATLTGAAVAAIGKEGIVAMGNVEESIMNQLKKSGNKVHERIAEMPFWDEYAGYIKSDIADIKNVGGPYAGCITAGKFLEHFTSYPWIHLDIAGTAFLTAEDSYRGKGGTGTGVRLLIDFLSHYA